MNFLQYTYLGNTLQHWIAAVVGFLVLFFCLRMLKTLLVRRTFAKEEKDLSHIGHFMSGLLKQTKSWFLAVAAIYLAQLILSLPETILVVLKTVFLTVTLLQIGLWGSELINLWIKVRTRRETEHNNHAIPLNGLGLIFRIVLWSLLVLLILDNIPGIEITTLVTSLGITGVAVALAVQNILGDLFASLSITLDQPFAIGDYINVGDLAGTVEHVGLKSTRIRSLSGEQIVFSNADLLNSRIRNYKRMERRRVVFIIGVTYDTNPEKLESIPALLKEIINQHEKVSFDRAHFKELGSSAFNFEVVYFVDTADYLTYMDIQQAINLEIVKCFTEKQIDFAFPTQTLMVYQPEVKE